jgi:hypothetical protein
VAVKAEELQNLGAKVAVVLAGPHGDEHRFIEPIGIFFYHEEHPNPTVNIIRLGKYPDGDKILKRYASRYGTPKFFGIRER